MKKLALLFITACSFPTEKPSGCTPETICAAAVQISESYCERRNVCWVEEYYSCKNDMVTSICEEYDCSAYYPASNRQKLSECISWYDGISCRDQEPPVCKVY